MPNRKLLNIELGRISAQEYLLQPRTGIVTVLDNIRSAHNVGSAFRSCDSFKADKVYLCGICATPPSPEIHKSALGAEYSVPWEHSDDTLKTIRELKKEGFTIVSIEQTAESLRLDDFDPYERDVILKNDCSSPRYALVFGNEVAGVGEDVVEESDICLEIPQFGTKHSLNVSVAVGIILWHFRLSMIRNGIK